MSVKHLEEKSNITTTSITETKLFDVLKQFNAYELNRIKKFLKSPYFNKNQNLVLLFEAVEDVLRNQTDSPTKHDIWLHITGSEQYDDMKFRKLCSDLLRLVEGFLLQEEFEQNHLLQAEYLLRAVQNKNITALESSALKSAERLSERYHFRPASYYYAQYAFEREIYSLNKLGIQKSKPTNIEQIASNLDKFFIAEKLRYFCDMLSRSFFNVQEYNLMFMDEIVNHLKDHDYDNVVPINLYYQIFLTYTQPEKTIHFNKLKRLIDEYIKLLPENEAKEILSSALNYCTNQINSGNNSYLREYLDLSELGIKKEILLVNGTLSPWVFRNIVVIGLRLKDFEWIEKFIHEYKYHIEEVYRENAVTINLANLYFYKKNYGDVLKLLQAVEYDDPSYNRNSKIMLLLTYYELGESESLTSLLSSFEIYLRRNKSLPENRKAPYLNLIKYLRSLVKIGGIDDAALLKLKKKVEETESIVNKEWLLEKIDELLNGTKKTLMTKKLAGKVQHRSV